VYGVRVSRHRRQRRRSVKSRRHIAPARIHDETNVVIRQTSRVERLAYTRSQAAEALGISRSTFIRRVLPYVETIAMPWGAQLIPVDELERITDERRRAATRARGPAIVGRPPRVAEEVVERIRAERAAGKTLRRIADDLTADRMPTAHGGRRWWPSTVRAVLLRA
jgi:hypothetical protein